MRVLHLSDLHYGAQAWGRASGLHRSELVESLLRFFTDPAREASLRPGHFDAIIITGDLTQRAAAAEFRAAADQIRDLARGLKVDLSAVVLTPGNHDIDWNLSKSDLARRFDPYREFLGWVYPSSLLKQIYGDLRDEGFVGVHQIGATSQGCALLFGSISSCLFERHDAHYGYVGKAQLDRLDERLRSVQATWRAVALHHHLLPNPMDGTTLGQAGEADLDETLCRDAGKVLQRLAALDVSMILHGHKHDPVSRWHRFASRGVTEAAGALILGAGSAGVKDDELPRRCRHHAEIIELGQSPLPRVIHLEAQDDEWHVVRTVTIPAAYDEMAALCQRLRGVALAPRRSLYDALLELPRVPGSAGRSASHLLDRLETLLVDEALAADAFWGLLEVGVLEFKDHRRYFDEVHPVPRSALRVIRIADRGHALLALLGWRDEELRA